MPVSFGSSPTTTSTAAPARKPVTTARERNRAIQPRRSSARRRNSAPVTSVIAATSSAASAPPTPVKQHRATRDRRERRARPRRDVPRRAEQRVDDRAGRSRVQPVLHRHARDARVAEILRHDHRRHREPGQHVAAQHRPVVLRQPAHDRQQATQFGRHTPPRHEAELTHPTGYDRLTAARSASSPVLTSGISLPERSTVPSRCGYSTKSLVTSHQGAIVAPPHSSGATSRTVCVSSQRWPPKSSTTPERSPYSYVVNSSTTRAPASRARANAASTSGTRTLMMCVTPPPLGATRSAPASATTTAPSEQRASERGARQPIRTRSRTRTPIRATPRRADVVVDEHPRHRRRRRRTIGRHDGPADYGSRGGDIDGASPVLFVADIERAVEYTASASASGTRCSASRPAFRLPPVTPRCSCLRSAMSPSESSRTGSSSTTCRTPTFASTMSRPFTRRYRTGCGNRLPDLRRTQRFPRVQHPGPDGHDIAFGQPRVDR